MLRTLRLIIPEIKAATVTVEGAGPCWIVAPLPFGGCGATGWVADEGVSEGKMGRGMVGWYECVPADDACVSRVHCVELKDYDEEED
jgi:hypothetical protein